MAYPARAIFVTIGAIIPFGCGRSRPGPVPHAEILIAGRRERLLVTKSGERRNAWGEVVPPGIRAKVTRVLGL